MHPLFRSRSLAAVILTATGVSGADGVLVGRDAIAVIANHEELCARDPGHADCTAEGREAACVAVRTAVPRLRADELEGAQEVEALLVRYVAGVLVDGACNGIAERGTPEEDRDTLFRAILIDRHADLSALAARVKDELDDQAGRVRQLCSNVGRSARGLADLAAAPEDATIEAEGETLSLKDFVGELCRLLPDSPRRLIDAFAAFRDRFAAVPAARYALDRLEAETYNDLAAMWEALLGPEECADVVPVADSWRVGLLSVKPGVRLTPPADPPTRLLGAGAAGGGMDVAGSLDELVDLLGRVADSRRQGVCESLTQRLEGRFVPAWDEARRVSQEADYHFVHERAFELDLLREAYSAATALAESCESDVNPSTWRDGYARYVVALVELLEPSLAETLSRYLGSRFDIDMSRR